MWLVGGGTVFNREEGKRVASGGRHFRPTSAASGFAGCRKESCEIGRGTSELESVVFQST